ncbi:MAG: hypothetical protein MJ054_01400 [Clostridia bacterium]|nr:hypothetical protein [Clostridia bacterium]
MVEKMKKVSLIGERTALKKIIDTLKSTGNFQITFFKSNTTALSPEDTTLKTHYQTELNRVTNVLKYLKVNDKKVTITYSNLKEVTKKENQIQTLLAKFEKEKIDTTSLQTQINLNQTTIDNVQQSRDLPVPAKLLKATKNTFVLAGLISNHDFMRLTNDIDTQSFIYETYPTFNQNLLVVITGDTENYPIAETILDYHFTSFTNDNNFECTPQQQIDFLMEQNQVLLTDLNHQLANTRPTQDQIDLLKTYYDYLINEIDTLEILTSTIQTKYCFIVNGWIPAHTVNLQNR